MYNRAGLINRSHPHPRESEPKIKRESEQKKKKRESNTNFIPLNCLGSSRTLNRELLSSFARQHRSELFFISRNTDGISCRRAKVIHGGFANRFFAIGETSGWRKYITYIEGDSFEKVKFQMQRIYVVSVSIILYFSLKKIFLNEF